MTKDEEFGLMWALGELDAVGIGGDAIRIVNRPGACFALTEDEVGVSRDVTRNASLKRALGERVPGCDGGLLVWYESSRHRQGAHCYLLWSADDVRSLVREVEEDEHEKKFPGVQFLDVESTYPNAKVRFVPAPPAKPEG